MACFGNCSHGLIKIASDLWTGSLAATFVKPSPVLETHALVVTEEVRCTNRAIGFCDFLRFVEQVGKREIELIGNPLHVCKAVFRVFGRVIGHDGDTADAQGFQFSGVANQAVLNGFDIGTVVADEHDEKAMGSPAILQCPDPAIDPGKRKTWGWRTEIAEGRMDQSHRKFLD